MITTRSLMRQTTLRITKTSKIIFLYEDVKIFWLDAQSVSTITNQKSKLRKFYTLTADEVQYNYLLKLK